jgi:outer membrane protein assembly factor BamA
MNKRAAYSIYYRWWHWVAILMLGSCSVYKRIPEGEKLYEGAEIKIKEKTKALKVLRPGMEEQIRPKPNKKILGLRIPLYLYQISKPPKGKGLNHLLRNKWGEAPVYASKVKPAYTTAVLNSFLQNNGYLQSNTRFEIQETEKSVKLIYRTEPGERYEIEQYEYPSDSSTLSKLLRSFQNESILKIGNPYRLDDIIAERERIDLALKEKGYFYFNPDYLLLEADSNYQGKVRLYLTVKEDVPAAALRPYRINQIQLFPNYQLEVDTTKINDQNQSYEHFRMYDPDSLFKPMVFDRSVFLQPDSIYSRSAHNITLRRLVNLGSFKYVRMQFIRLPEVDSLGIGSLNATAYLTPYKKRTIQLQLNGNSKSNNFVGSEIKLQMLNRNVFRGAEQLDINLGGGFETQVGGNQLSTNAYTINGEVGLNFPRFVSPFKIINPRTGFVPKTRIALAYEFLNRKDLYNLTAIRGSFGYNWKRNNYWEHGFQPFSFSYALPSNITDAFRDILSQDLTLQQSFDRQFIVGSTYNLRFSNQMDVKRWNTSFADFNIDLSGNTLGLLSRDLNGDGLKQLLNVPFSQYLKFTVDLRNYWKLKEKSYWVNRLVLGYGYAYGNSSSLPFVKQYFIGGSNSIRAFRARTLGPGSYQSPNSQLLASEAGDVKLEMSTEWRMPLFSVLQGALFVDAGNIWLRQESATKPGSGLQDWWKELAVGTGAGLRIDASILVIRFDVAVPARKPWLPEGSRWVMDQWNWADRDWRRENIVLNIAIGYPF